ncbi:hypothetical protein [Bacillus thuringiensis]|nr:hypothetical protein [Bacillus thuringiensis]
MMKKNIITLICIGLVADGKGKRTLLYWDNIVDVIQSRARGLED